MEDLVLANSSVVFDEEKGTVNLIGSMRLASLKEYDVVKSYLQDCSNHTNQLIMDLSELQFLNSSGITTLSMFILKKKSEENFSLKIIGNKDVFWQEKSIQNFKKLWGEIEIVI